MTKENVTYWDLIKGYISHNHPNEIVAYLVNGIGESNDFLSYSDMHKFDSIEEMEKWEKGINDDDFYYNCEIIMYDGNDFTIED